MLAPAMTSRRRFLKVGLLGTALLGAAAIVGRNLSGYTLDAEVPLKALSKKELIVLAAACERICATDRPDAPAPDGLAMATWLDGYIAGMDAAVRRDLSALFALLEHGSSLFRFRATRFTRMSIAERDATLADWQSSALDVRRQGFQGLRALAFLAYWRQDRTWPLLGYPGPLVQRVPS